jgi:protein required for attachment to host cells
MHIPNGGFVLIIDGRKMLLFRNDGDEEYPDLHVVDRDAQPDRPDREQKSDAPGRTGFLAAGRSSSYDETDFHRQGEERFAARAIRRLNGRAQAGEFDKLVIAADPRTLAEMRRHYGKALQRALIAEVDKDLVNHPLVDIERILIAE